MADPTGYLRRVGAMRPSHLMFTSGVGSIVDLPNFSVLVKGLGDWRYEHLGSDRPVITEPRLLAAVQAILGKTVKELRPAPWLPGTDADPKGNAAKTGVPVAPFPSWMRCTACNLLAPIDTQAFGFKNDKPSKPHEAGFFHDCGKGKKPRLVVGARFMLACTAGHLDDFPYLEFVHRGGGCAKAPKPRLRMEDFGGNIGANVRIVCERCDEARNIREVMGRKGRAALPRCRGRHPHLGTFDGGCEKQPHLIVVGASNQWFADTLSALAVPKPGKGELDAKVEQFWANLQHAAGPNSLLMLRSFPHIDEAFAKWPDNEVVWAAIERYRDGQEVESTDAPGQRDLLTPEWQVFSAPTLPEATDDFTLYRHPDGVPSLLKGYYADVVQAERLREVRAMIGFTRLDAPDFEDPELVTRVPLTGSKPNWVPASEVRGEGIFLRVPEDLLTAWEERVRASSFTDEHSGQTRSVPHEHREAYGRFRDHRYSDRIPLGFDRYRGWPDLRYYALHTLSHLLIRTIALECGYNSASLSERIYAGTEDDPRSGILIYTAVPDAEGTLGGLVSLAEPEELVRLTRRALSEARHCSSDPLCAERLPRAPEDFLHGAACHVCLFVSETTCERGNRFLDRRFIVPIDGSDLALYPEIP